MSPARLVYSPALAAYAFPEGHPLAPIRLIRTIELIRALELADDADFVEPRPATDEELARVHAPDYIAAVRRLSEPGAQSAAGLEWGIGTGDVPVVEDMHEAAALVAGATLRAAELVMGGHATRAFQPAGGLHHAHRARAAGFCVYNDLAVAIAWLREAHDARVLYVDYDAHHGDGVQELFYADPDVLTVSFHESGRYLFPGTGWVDETGADAAHGTAINVPLEAGTGDVSYWRLFEALVPRLADVFRPDVIVLQNGCDAHWLDPLAHLRCTTRLFERFVRLTCDVADRWCQGRVIATGGGGYAVHSVVPRAWTLVWAALRGVTAPDPIPRAWLDHVLASSGVAVPATLRDPEDAVPPIPDEAGISARNLRTLEAVQRTVLPLLTGWGMEF
ncbi:MAG: acetoin utilization protein AcuC [Longimicrobiales bacterium]